MVEEKVATGVPRFELSNFKVGIVSDIRGDKWGEYISAPSEAGGEVLEGVLSSKYFSDSGSHLEWAEAQVFWRPAQVIDPEIQRHILMSTVSEEISLGSPFWSNLTVDYKRYAAFTVTATFRGKVVGPYRALFLFGTDNHGNEVVANNDLISGDQALWDMLRKPLYPAGLIQSRLREVPFISDWIKNNEVSAQTCATDLCCSHGSCGLSPTAVTRDLSRPISQPLPAN